jgi:hypothetical protein
MASKQKVVIFLVSMAFSTACSQEKTYHDFTNGGRGIDTLKVDYATCGMQIGPPRVNNSGCRGCGLLDAQSAIMNNDNAMDRCMGSLGWERR